MRLNNSELLDCLINRKSDGLLKEQFYKSLVFGLSLFAVVKEKKPHFLGSLLILYGYDAIQLHRNIRCVDWKVTDFAKRSNKSTFSQSLSHGDFIEVTILLYR